MPDAAPGDPLAAASALLDALSEPEARAALRRCCGSTRWVAGMLARRPFGSGSALGDVARDSWSALGRDDYLEAFAEHPPIGESNALSARLAPTAGWSSSEQSGVNAAAQATLAALAAGNRAYRERFGYTFIVCATGKTADEMLATLLLRLDNDADTELFTAAAEQAKITLLRLAKLAAEPQPKASAS
jgi:2-oxo-4-hydroxy-4-carboxy-5-ureidoimidazoline decarboxylase